MKKTRWIRGIALCLSLVLLVGVVGALSYDLNGDGKTNVWDLQLAFNQNKPADEKAAALREAFGGQGDELHPNAEGVYEIWSQVGLYNMAAHAAEDATFRLMADIDLKGIDWAPIKDFQGVLEGNGHTIKNVNITKAVTGSDGANMGFFAAVNYDSAKTQSVVKDLYLENVTITVPTDETLDVRYVGLLAGSNRGIIENCASVGVINDSRTNLKNANFFGTMVGRNNNSNPDGKVIGTNGMTVLDTATTYTHTQKVHSMMAMNFAELQEGSKTRSIGIAGYSKDANIDTTLLWQDITNSTTFVSEALQQRRQTVVDYMYEMCTVEWTPSQKMTLTYYKSKMDPSTSTYTVGQIYRGIPYNHGSSGLERFAAQMDVVGGVYTTKSSLPTTAYYLTDSKVIKAVSAGTTGETVTATNSTGKTVSLVVPEGWDHTKNSGTFVTGFAMYVGNDCSSAAAWAWRRVSAISGTDFAHLLSTSSMMPTEDYQVNSGKTKNGYITTYGLVPVNGLSFSHPHKDMDSDGVTDANQDLNGDGKVNNSDYADMVEAVFAQNKTYYLESLGAATRGDILVGYNDDGGHTRVLAGDAVMIRDYKGVIQPKLSYVVTHEQGRGSNGTDNGVAWKSSCTVNCKYTFDQLTNYKDYTKIGSACCYFPVTCKALQVEDTPAAVATCSMSSGKITSNFHIVSTTVGDETVYTNCTQSGSRNRCVELTVKTAHPSVKTGDVVKVLLSNGDIYEFTY